jgi:hypothetical protein
MIASLVISAISVVVPAIASLMYKIGIEKGYGVKSTFQIVAVLSIVGVLFGIIGFIVRSVSNKRIRKNGIEVSLKQRTLGIAGLIVNILGFLYSGILFGAIMYAGSVMYR